MWSNPRARTAVDCREMDRGNVREEIVVVNACGGKSGSHGSKDCLILIPFRLPQISCFIFSLKCFSSDSDNCPDVGIGPLLQFPYPLRAGPILLILLFPLQFLHPTEFCMVLYILFHWSGTPVCSQLVFCMYFCV